ncbi:hypothetical protein OG21DRAFT_1423147, partial [Imleria badia]
SLWVALGLTAAVSTQKGGSVVQAGNIQVSAMMVRLFLASFILLFQISIWMFLRNPEKAYILDKAEGNATQINGHSAWAAVWLAICHSLASSLFRDFNTYQTQLTDKHLLCIRNAWLNSHLCPSSYRTALYWW